MVPAGNKAKRLSSVNYTTKTIHHHHHGLADVTNEFVPFSPLTPETHNVGANEEHF